jgi:ATP-dependent Clp protease ATP-binding subunit ClpA
MFERYTEKARRVIFFARYEASQYGSNYIDAEHLLLGILREDRALLAYLLQDPTEASAMQSEIESRAFKGEKFSTSVDLPLSNAAKRVMAYAAEEAERLADRHIGSEHLFLGLLREKDSLAAAVLTQHGIKLEETRSLIAQRGERRSEDADVMGSAEAVTHEIRGRASAHMVRRWLEIVSDTDGALLGKTPAINIPAVGAELVFLEKRYQVRRVVHHFTNKEAVEMLWPEKIVVHVVSIEP